MIVQDGLSLVNLLAYVDLNPIRAGIVKMKTWLIIE